MLLQALLLGSLATSSTLAQTVHSVLVFTRHGDRTAKYFSGYQMTNLGALQVYSSGNFYRQRYVEEGADFRISGLEPNNVNYRQVWASAPDQAVLFQTATNFLQGLYPPLGDLNETLAVETLTNGTDTTDPLNGYQFILVHGESETDPDTIWIKGDDACPAYSRASKSYSKSDAYQSTLNSTSEFYQQFEGLLGPIMGAENVSYAQAYDVFDLLNVASIHNESIADEINPDDLSQLRYLANEWEWNHNYNATQPERSIGGKSLAGGILRQLDTMVSSGGRRNKFNLMAGSYDTFMSFFGLTDLMEVNSDFMGLPDYASSMVFELFSNEGSTDGPTPFPTQNPREQLMVRFLFRNGTDSSDELVAFPLFGRDNDLAIPYGKFVDELSGRAINSVGQWCAMCQSEEDFCVAANSSSTGCSQSSASTSSGSGLSNAAAGGIGAGVTLAVVGILALAWFLLKKKKNAASNPPITVQEKKRASDSEGESV